MNLRPNSAINLLHKFVIHNVNMSNLQHLLFLQPPLNMYALPLHLIKLPHTLLNLPQEPALPLNLNTFTHSGYLIQPNQPSQFSLLHFGLKHFHVCQLPHLPTINSFKHPILNSISEPSIRQTLQLLVFKFKLLLASTSLFNSFFKPIEEPNFVLQPL
jgi:hypothetical protein